MRLIDADALIDEVMERYCEDCSKRKGLKNGKWRVVYSVGDVPCRACGIGDMMDEMDSAPTIDAVQVVRCKDCQYAHMSTDGSVKYCEVWFPDEAEYIDGDDYCAYGVRGAIVRCGECKHLMPSGICEAFADGRVRPSASDFCSYGERRSE